MKDFTTGGYQRAVPLYSQLGHRNLLKNLVCQQEPTTSEDMLMRIRRAFTEITPHILANTESVRVGMCLQYEGGHFNKIFNSLY